MVDWRGAACAAPTPAPLRCDEVGARWQNQRPIPHEHDPRHE